MAAGERYVRDNTSMGYVYRWVSSRELSYMNTRIRRPILLREQRECDRKGGKFRKAGHGSNGALMEVIWGVGSLHNAWEHILDLGWLALEVDPDQ